MANPLYGQNKADSYLDFARAAAAGDTANAGYLGNYLDFLGGYVANLTATGIDITQAEGVAGVKGGDETLAEVDAVMLIKNAVSTFAGTGAAATSVYLPEPEAGDHLAMEITGDIDQTGAVSIHSNNSVGTIQPSSVVLAKQIIGGLNGATALPIETAGTYTTPTSENLIYTAAAADTNALGAGSMIHFFAVADGVWLVKISFIPEGTGATGALTVSQKGVTYG